MMGVLDANGIDATISFVTLIGTLPGAALTRGTTAAPPLTAASAVLMVALLFLNRYLELLFRVPLKVPTFRSSLQHYLEQIALLQNDL